MKQIWKKINNENCKEVDTAPTNFERTNNPVNHKRLKVSAKAHFEN